MNVTQTITRKDNLLRDTLRANSIFSGVSGLVLVVGFAPLANFIGVAWAWTLIVLGIGLLGYAFLLMQASRRAELEMKEAMVFIVSDVVWVLLSVVLLLTDWIPFTIEGRWLIVILADVVACFAVLQFIGARRIGGTR